MDAYNKINNKKKKIEKKYIKKINNHKFLSEKIEYTKKYLNELRENIKNLEKERDELKEVTKKLVNITKEQKKIKNKEITNKKKSEKLFNKKLQTTEKQLNKIIGNEEQAKKYYDVLNQLQKLNAVLNQWEKIQILLENNIGDKKDYRKFLLKYHPDKTSKLDEKTRTKYSEISKQVIEAFKSVGNMLDDVKLFTQ